MNLPNGYPDEVIYSIVARWQVRTGIFDPYPTSELLFGCKSRKTVLGIPTGLKYLINHSSMSSDELIYSHTLYPYYKGFQHWADLKYILESPYAMFSKVEKQHHLACCPACIESDFKLFGEAYWHRVHLLPGVLVCPHHNIRLITHCPTCGQAIACKEEYKVTPLYCPAGHSLLHSTRNLNAPYLTISQDSYFILNFGWRRINVRRLESIYATVVREHADREFWDNPPCPRTMYYKGIKFLKNDFYVKFREEFYSYFGEELFDGLSLVPFHSGVFESERSRHTLDWLYRMLFRIGQQSFPPIAHILLMNFLFGSCRALLDNTAGLYSIEQSLAEVASAVESPDQLSQSKSNVTL